MSAKRHRLSTQETDFREIRYEHLTTGGHPIW